MRSHSSEVFGAQRGNRLSKDGCEHLSIDIGQLPDIQTALADGVLAQMRQSVFPIASMHGIVENKPSFSRREADEWHISFAAAFVSIVTAPETYDGRTPHLRLFSSGGL